MSKAFTRESDDLPERPEPARRSALPPGVKNLITADGQKRLQDELNSFVRRLPVEEQGSSQTGIRRLAELRTILETAIVAAEPPAHDDRIRFGARVSIREGNGTVVQYRIVGVDEIDLAEENISWRSPLASALLNKKAGDRVSVRLPAGEQGLEVLSFSYHH